MYQDVVKGRPERVDDWSNVPVFGARPESSEWVIRSTFLDGVIVGSDSTPGEPDHELVWVGAEEATRTLSHKSQRWAVKQWQGHPQSKTGKD